MKANWQTVVLALALLVPATRSRAGLAYPDPTGGWSYLYRADPGQDVFGDGSSFDALDGLWSHTNGSDQWDGSSLGGDFVPGSNAPGGAGIFNEGGVSFLRIQDPGDPRDFNPSFGDPGNRKIYFGHDISADGAPENALDVGVTISFRARIPTKAKSTSPLDPLYPNGQGTAGPKPYPDAGDGYVTSDGGKGNFVIKQQAGGAFAFSLAVADDQSDGDPGLPKAGFNGLTMNEFNGNAISGNVNFGQGSGTNVLALDPTDWHEFWIVLRKDPANIGTHEALIYVDGSTTAKFFKITAGTGDDYSGIGYLAMGATATPQNAALDVDFFAFKTEAVFPPGALANLPPELQQMTPARGTRYADAGLGFRVTGLTQPPNSIPIAGATLVLNGEDLSAGLVASGDVRERTFSLAGLQPNRLYQGTVVLADQAGRKSTNAVNFDTFVQASTLVAEFTDFASQPTLTLPPSLTQVYLLAGSTLRQQIKVVGGNATLGIFTVPNTGSADAPLLVPLTDAFGQPVVLPAGTGSATAFTLIPLDGAGAIPREVLAVPTALTQAPGYVAVTSPVVGASGVRPDTTFVAELVASSSVISNPRLLVDGVLLSPQPPWVPTANGVKLSYQPTVFLAPGNHSAQVLFEANSQFFEPSWNFTVTDPPRLKPSWRTDFASVNGQTRGFKGRIHVARQDASADLFPNNPERAANQLAGTLIDPDTSAPFVNEAVGASGTGAFVENDTLNYEQTAVDKGLPGDRAFPNTEASDVNNLALEVTTYLSLGRGTFRLGVACDDGFVVWAGPSVAATTNQFGFRSPGGSTSDQNFDVLVEEPGVYAFRLVYFEGGGGADLEWYTISFETGEKLLINSHDGVDAWQSRNGDGTDAVTVPTLSATLEANGDIVVTFTGSLQSAATLGGTFNSVIGSSSPYRIRAADAAGQQYFRASN